MIKIASAAAIALIACALAANSAAASGKGYKSHIDPDGKLHCFDVGKSCISWAL